MRYSIQRRYRLFAKSYGVLSFTTNMGKNIGKNIITKLSGKYSQISLDNAK